MSKEKLTDEYQSNLSNDEMVELAKKQYETKQVSDYKFPTEIVDLPSKGLVYSKENPLSSGKVEMKYMTAKEEDILTTQSYIKDGTVLDRLFQSLILGNGDGVPIKYIDLTTGDKNAIMIAARVLGYGKDYKVEIQDPFSDNKQEEVIDLTQFEAADYDGKNQIELHKNEFEYELPKSKRKIIFYVCVMNGRNQMTMKWNVWATKEGRRSAIRGTTNTPWRMPKKRSAKAVGLQP